MNFPFWFLISSLARRPQGLFALSRVPVSPKSGTYLLNLSSDLTFFGRYETLSLFLFTSVTILFLIHPDFVFL